MALESMGLLSGKVRPESSCNGDDKLARSLWFGSALFPARTRFNEVPINNIEFAV